jgi:hypothetical protein
MCGYNRLSGNRRSGMERRALRETTAATPARTLLAHLGLETRVTAEVQDMYSRPVRSTPILPLVTGEHRVPRASTGEAA